MTTIIKVPNNFVKQVQEFLADLQDQEQKKHKEAIEKQESLNFAKKEQNQKEPNQVFYDPPIDSDDVTVILAACLKLGIRMEWMSNPKNLKQFCKYDFFHRGVWAESVSYSSIEVLLLSIKEAIDKIMRYSGITYIAIDRDETDSKYQDILFGMKCEEFLDTIIEGCSLLTMDEFSWLRKNQHALFAFQKIKEMCPNICIDECCCKHDKPELLKKIKEFIANCRCNGPCSCGDKIPLPSYYSTNY